MPPVIPTLLVPATRATTEAQLPTWTYNALVPSTRCPLPPLLAAVIQHPQSILQGAAAVTSTTQALDDIKLLFPELLSVVSAAADHPIDELLPCSTFPGLAACLLIAALSPVAIRLFRPVLAEVVWLWHSSRGFSPPASREHIEALLRPVQLPGVTSAQREQREALQAARSEAPPPQKKTRL